MKEQLQAIVTVLSLVNPAICGAMFAQIEENRSRGQQVADAIKAVLATTVILTVSALIGTSCFTYSECPSMPSWWRAAACWHGWAFPC
jgi:small neutral amino acid transporter SnatA (MarC family)